MTKAPKRIIFKGQTKIPFIKIIRKTWEAIDYMKQEQIAMEKFQQNIKDHLEIKTMVVKFNIQ